MDSGDSHKTVATQTEANYTTSNNLSKNFNMPEYPPLPASLYNITPLQADYSYQS